MERRPEANEEEQHEEHEKSSKDVVDDAVQDDDLVVSGRLHDESLVATSAIEEKEEDETKTETTMDRRQENKNEQHHEDNEKSDKDVLEDDAVQDDGLVNSGTLNDESVVVVVTTVVVEEKEEELELKTNNGTKMTPPPPQRQGQQEDKEVPRTSAVMEESAPAAQSVSPVVGFSVVDDDDDDDDNNNNNNNNNNKCDETKFTNDDKNNNNYNIDNDIRQKRDNEEARITKKDEARNDQNAKIKMKMKNGNMASPQSSVAGVPQSFTESTTVTTSIDKQTRTARRRQEGPPPTPILPIPPPLPLRHLPPPQPQQQGRRFSEAQVHEMGLALFAAPSWRTRRRRRQSLTACATDLGQRLQQASHELLETLATHFSSETQEGGGGGGLALPVTALSWLLLLWQAHTSRSNYNTTTTSTNGNRIDDTSSFSSSSWDQVLLRHHYYNDSSAEIRSQLQRLFQLLLPQSTTSGNNDDKNKNTNKNTLIASRLLHLRVTRSFATSTTATTTTTRSGSTATTTTTVWPSVTTHRDLSWQEFSSASLTTHHARPTTNKQLKHSEKKNSPSQPTLPPPPPPQQWLQAYIQWQAQPRLSVFHNTTCSATASSRLLSPSLSLLSNLTVLWLDQVPTSSFDATTGLLPSLAPHLKVLRIERTSLEPICFVVVRYNTNSVGRGDIFQQQQPQQPLTVSPQSTCSGAAVAVDDSDRDGGVDLLPEEKQGRHHHDDPLAPPPPKRESTAKLTVYPQLTHLKFTHCSLPMSLSLDDEVDATWPPFWSHFPALQTLNLSHNSLGEVGLEALTPPRPVPQEGVGEGSNSNDHTRRRPRTNRPPPQPTRTLLQDLSMLTNLQRLNLSYNQLVPHSLHHIQYHVGNLVELNVSYNALTTCTGLDRLYSLERLFLHHNQLPDLASIRGLACLPQLTVLTLFGNPLAAMQTTRSTRLQSFQTKKKNATTTTNNNKSQRNSNSNGNNHTTSSNNGISNNHTTSNINTGISSMKSLYRLAVLDLFRQGRRSRSDDNDNDNNNNNNDIAYFQLVLDHEPISPQERDLLRVTGFAIQLPAPKYSLPLPLPLLSVSNTLLMTTTLNKNHNHDNDAFQAVPLEEATIIQGSSQDPRQIPNAFTNPLQQRPRRRRRAVVLESNNNNNRVNKRTREQQQFYSNDSSGRNSNNKRRVQAPLLKFDAADILQTLCRPMFPEATLGTPTESKNDTALTATSKDEDEKNGWASKEKLLGQRLSNSTSIHGEASKDAMEPSASGKSSQGQDQQRDFEDRITSSITAAKPGKKDTNDPASAAVKEEDNLSILKKLEAKDNIDNDSKPAARDLNKASRLPTAETLPTGPANPNDDGDDRREKSTDGQATSAQMALSVLPISPIRRNRKNTTISLHSNNISPAKEQDTSKASNSSDATTPAGGGGGADGSVLRFDDVSVDSSRNAMLNSAMLMMVPSSEQQQQQQNYSWRPGGGGGDDCSTSMPSSVANSQMDDRTKFALAEKNSTFVGPHTYKQLTIHDNLEIYFKLFVFSSSVATSSSNMLFFDPEELIWQHVLENYPRIQLWPVDRRIQETEAAKNMGPTGPSAQEDFRRVWREWVVACGKPALKRLTPTRSPRLGFHGEFVYPPTSTLDLAAGVTNSSSSTSGRPETVTRERNVVLCASTAAFYVILDHDKDTTIRQQQKKPRKSFPKPIPKDACFAEAIWPHALARHSWTSLNAITIGFNFQRLTLRFVQPTIPGSPSSKHTTKVKDEFCYILLTCNKLETVSLLKEFQDLTVNIAVAFDTPGTGIGVAIENDDPIVLDALGNAVQNNSFGSICHFQIVHQYWKKGDRGTVRRLCVVTDSRMYLFDENYCGDGSKDADTADTRIGEWGKPQYSTVDEAYLVQVVSVQAATSDPCSLTISISPTSRLSRTHNWRLICRDREGAERLIEEVRKAVSTAKR
ncbi:hypothetical protein ACA910_020124 [Epithemia clementina (nom. ined.)]